MSETSIVDAQEDLTRRVMDWEGVTGTAVGLLDGEPCIKVYVAVRDEALLSRLPETHMGFPVSVEVTGRFERRGP